MADEEVIETATGLGYVELVEGTGPRAKAGDSVSVHYTKQGQNNVASEIVVQKKAS